MNQYVKTTLILFGTLAICLLLLAGCADKEPPTPTLLTQMEEREVLQESHQRGIHSVQEADAEVYFSMVYTGDLDEILLNSSSHLGALIKAHNFQLTDPFVIDEEMKGIILRLYEAPAEPIVLAKEISRCDEVLMVEVKNAKPLPM